MYVYSCISLIKVWPQKCLFLGFLTCLEWQYHNNNLAWWGFLLRKSSTFFSSLPSLSPPDIWLLSIARQEKCLFENRSIIIKNLVVECNECFACLYESRKKLQIGSFFGEEDRKRRCEERRARQFDKKMYFYNLHQSKVWMQHLEKNLIRGKNVKESRRQQRVRSTKSSSSFVVSSQ